MNRDWSRPFRFENPYDLLAVPQNATPKEVEAAVNDLLYELLEQSNTEDERASIHTAQAVIVDPDEREYLDGQPETRLLALQDIVYPPSEDPAELRILVERLFDDSGASLRSLSALAPAPVTE